MGDYYRGGGGGGYRGSYRGGGRGSGSYYDDQGGGGGYNDGGGGNYRGRSSRGRSSGYYDRDYQGGGGGGYSGGRGGFYNDDNNWRGGSSRGRSRGGRYQGDWGRSSRGGGSGRHDSRRRDVRETEAACPDVQPPVEVLAHNKKLAAIGVDPTGTIAQLYTASHDGTVKGWNVTNGECTVTLDVGGPADSLLLSGGFLFVGMQKLDEGIIKVWNMANSANHQLPGHRGQILCMYAAGGLLFSGGQDRSVRVWNFNAAAGIFMSQSIITKAEGGHEAAVHAFQSYGSFLFSADRSGCIKVWDLNTGQIAQTIDKAHNETISQMLMWESYLLTASSDGLIKTWEIMEAPMPNLVVKPQPAFSFSKDAEEDGGGGGSAPRNVYRRTKNTAIFTMSGTLDHVGAPVLMVAYLGEPFVRLYDLPSFSSRGALIPAPETSTMSMLLTPDGKGHMMILGDRHGKMRIFGWQVAL